jgi:hypothetical protein
VAVSGEGRPVGGIVIDEPVRPAWRMKPGSASSADRRGDERPGTGLLLLASAPSYGFVSEFMGIL